jgi:uncharacterized protein (UPF0335 family)
VTSIYKYTALFLLAVAVVLGFLYSYASLKITRLESEKTALKMEVKSCKMEVKSCNDSIKEFNDAQIRAGDTIQKVREVVRTVKSDCNCYDIAVDKRILDRVRKH